MTKYQYLAFADQFTEFFDMVHNAARVMAKRLNQADRKIDNILFGQQFIYFDIDDKTYRMPVQWIFQPVSSLDALFFNMTDDEIDAMGENA